MKRSLVSSVLLVLTAACSHSPIAREHSLFPPLGISTNTEPSASTRATIGVDAGTVPESIDRPQWVVIDAAGTTRILTSDRWIEPLKLAIPRTIAYQIQQTLPDTLVWATSGAGSARPDVRLRIDVAAWEAVLEKYVRIDLVWHIDHAKMRRVGRGSFVLPVDNSLPASLLQAQREALTKGSVRIAEEVRDVLRTSPQ